MSGDTNRRLCATFECDREVLNLPGQICIPCKLAGDAAVDAAFDRLRGLVR